MEVFCTPSTLSTTYTTSGRLEVGYLGGKAAESSVTCIKLNGARPARSLARTIAGVPLLSSKETFRVDGEINSTAATRAPRARPIRISPRTDLFSLR